MKLTATILNPFYNRALTFLSYLNRNSFRIIYGLLDLAFLVTALNLAVPGLQSLLPVLQKADYHEITSVLLFNWLVLGNILAVPLYVFKGYNNKRRSYVEVLVLVLFLIPLINLGFLAFNWGYMYFIGIYSALTILTKGIQRLVRNGVRRVHG